MKEALGTRIRPERNKAERCWEIARQHLKPVIAALVDRFGEVDVFLEFSTTERCDTRCEEAAGDDCTCSCMGDNHGGAVYWKRWQLVGETTLVRSASRKERRYLVDAKNLTAGWQ
ncbi:hypothetical protein [Streptomyces sp. MP131-18]|uniref:hypothetical protein n=1 Tax=Streptomyces sp. MP131-18 TaxID=1857892 RepID=UPI001C0B45D5|nr:hypothetical protein [Streptomyces sp. MP131-18]